MYATAQPCYAKNPRECVAKYCLAYRQGCFCPGSCITYGETGHLSLFEHMPLRVLPMALFLSCVLVTVSGSFLNGHIYRRYTLLTGLLTSARLLHGSHPLAVKVPDNASSRFSGQLIGQVTRNVLQRSYFPPSPPPGLRLIFSTGSSLPQGFRRPHDGPNLGQAKQGTSGRAYLASYL
jgi:hypothetical protein